MRQYYTKLTRLLQLMRVFFPILLIPNNLYPGFSNLVGKSPISSISVQGSSTAASDAGVMRSAEFESLF